MFSATTEYFLTGQYNVALRQYCRTVSYIARLKPPALYNETFCKNPSAVRPLLHALR